MWLPDTGLSALTGEFHCPAVDGGRGGREVGHRDSGCSIERWTHICLMRVESGFAPRTPDHTVILQFLYI